MIYSGQVNMANCEQLLCMKVLSQLVVSLTLSQCGGLTELPESLGRLTALTALHLKYCPGLTGLPESLGDLTALQLLDLRDCIVTSFGCF